MIQYADPVVTYRPTEARDWATLADIALRAFAGVNAEHGFPADFADSEEDRIGLAGAFALPFVEGIVAEANGELLGSAFLWRLGEVVGVGPVTVKPGSQSSGIGRHLMAEILHLSEGAASVRLLQAAFNRRSMALYASLGFEVKEPLVGLQGPVPRVVIPGHTVRPGIEDDMAAVAEVGRYVHGFERTLEFGGAIQQGHAAVVEHKGRIVGYTTGVGFYGHTVATTNDGLKALIAAAPEIAGSGLFLPSRNADLFRWCLRHGLRITSPMTLMSTGEYQEPRGAFLPSILF